MVKQVHTKTRKVRNICCQNKFEATPAGDMQCIFRDVSVKCDKNFLRSVAEKVSFANPN